jgi:hypothetical protein
MTPGQLRRAGSRRRRTYLAFVHADRARRPDLPADVDAVLADAPPALVP